jgi:hypothetical protein
MPTRTRAQKAAAEAAYVKWAAQEQRRITRQRRFLTRGQGPGVEKIIQAMLDRAWDLLDAGEAEAADALLEFVPAERAEALLREFFPEVYA